MVPIPSVSGASLTGGSDFAAAVRASLADHASGERRIWAGIEPVRGVENQLQLFDGQRCGGDEAAGWHRECWWRRWWCGRPACWLVGLEVEDGLWDLGQRTRRRGRPARRWVRAFGWRRIECFDAPAAPVAPPHVRAS